MRLKGGRERFAVVRIDLHERPLRVRPIAVPFYGHGVAFDPRDPGRALVFEKHGPGCCEVDLRRGHMVRQVEASAGCQFYGHGAFSPDGALLYCTETEMAGGTMRGLIAVRDGRSLQLRGELPSHGAAPHDLLLCDKGRVLVVGNGGGSPASGRVPNVAWVATDSGVMLWRQTLDDPGVTAGHLALADDGAGQIVAVVSAPRDGLDLASPSVHGGVGLARRDPAAPAAPAAPTSTAAQARVFRDPIAAKMRGETLSLALLPGGLVAATNPEGDLITVWERRSGKLRSGHDTFGRPRGLSLDRTGRCLALSHGADARLTLLDPQSLKALPGASLEQAWISGSHLAVCDLGG